MSRQSSARGCAIICAKSRFIEFVESRLGPLAEPREAVAEYVRVWCGIGSRRELDTNPVARSAWLQLAPVVYLLCEAAKAGKLKRYNKPGISWVVYRKVAG